MIGQTGSILLTLMGDADARVLNNISRDRRSSMGRGVELSPNDSRAFTRRKALKPILKLYAHGGVLQHLPTWLLLA